MPAIRTRSIGRAFADPVHDAQASFRAIIGAMSEPGTIHSLAALIEAPPALHTATAISLLTLADQDTPLWLCPQLGADAAEYLRFHCGAPIASRAKVALFGVVSAADDIHLAAFNAGDDRYPDRSATIVLQCDALTGGSTVSLAGPGIQGTRAIAPLGLRSEFWQQAAINHASYPLGVDMLLVSDSQIMALPRSTAITLAREHA